MKTTPASPELINLNLEEHPDIITAIYNTKDNRTCFKSDDMWLVSDEKVLLNNYHYLNSSFLSYCFITLKLWRLDEDESSICIMQHRNLKLKRFSSSKIRIFELCVFNKDYKHSKEGPEILPMKAKTIPEFITYANYIQRDELKQLVKKYRGTPRNLEHKKHKQQKFIPIKDIDKLGKLSDATKHALIYLRKVGKL